MGSSETKSAVNFKAIVEGGVVLYLIMTPDAPKYTIVAASDAYLNATKRTREELVGLGIFEAFPENPDELRGTGLSAVRGSIERAIKTKTTDVLAVTKYDIPRSKEDGGGFEARYWSPIHFPVFDNHGELLYITQRVEDVTELIRVQEKGFQQSKMNEELKARAVKMEQEVMVRAQEVKKANIGLVSANEELEAFSSAVSHDLRAPLRSMVGFSKILIEDYSQVLDQAGREFLVRITISADKMGRMIDGLLNLSKISRGEMSKQSVDLSVLAQGIFSELQMLHPARKVTFTLEPSLCVCGDPSLLELVLQNLINNSWKFTSEAESAQIEFGSSVIDGRTTYFVRDNGAGFDMHYSGQLFGIFQRLHSAKEFEGTGIGLATVRRIIQRHGGKVWAEGSVGNGATFYFTID